jgi:RNA polymerase sigma-70 factor (ECF subfamily)
VQEPQLATLIEQVKTGDRLAFRLLYERFHAGLYQLALRLLKSEALVEEVVHDVFLKIWEGREGLKTDTSFQSYLFTICRNQALDVLKKAAREQSLRQQISEGWELQVEQQAFEAVFNSAQQKALRAVKELPIQRQEVFRLAKVEGLSYDEIAQKLNISKSTVSDHLVKAMKSIRAKIDEKEG